MSFTRDMENKTNLWIRKGQDILYDIEDRIFCKIFGLRCKSVTYLQKNSLLSKLKILLANNNVIPRYNYLTHIIRQSSTLGTTWCTTDRVAWKDRRGTWASRRRRGQSAYSGSPTGSGPDRRPPSATGTLYAEWPALPTGTRTYRSCAAWLSTRARSFEIFSAAPDPPRRLTAPRPDRGRSRSATGRCRRTSSANSKTSFFLSEQNSRTTRDPFVESQNNFSFGKIQFSFVPPLLLPMLSLQSLFNFLNAIFSIQFSPFNIKIKYLLYYLKLRF